MKKIILSFILILLFINPLFAVEISQFSSQSAPFGYTVGIPIDNFASARFSDTKFVVVYSDNSTSEKYGVACVGNINTSNNTISWASPSVFTPVNTPGTYCKVTTIGADTIVVIYYNTLNTYNTIRVGTIDGSDNITWNTTSTALQATGYPSNYSIITLDSDKFVTASIRANSLAVNLITCETNKTITIESSDGGTFSGGGYVSLTKITPTKFALFVAYPNYNIVKIYNVVDQGGGSYTILLGTTTSVFNNTSTLYYPNINRLSDSKIAISYADTPGILKGKARCASLDENNNLTWGDPLTYTNNQSTHINSIDINANNFIINYTDQTTSGYGKSLVITENNLTLTPNDIITYINSDVVFSSSSLLMSSARFINFYSCGTSSYNGVAKIGLLSYPTTGYINKLNGITIQSINGIVPAKINGI